MQKLIKERLEFLEKNPNSKLIFRPLRQGLKMNDTLSNFCDELLMNPSSASIIMDELSKDPELKSTWDSMAKMAEIDAKLKLDFDTATLATGECGELLISVNGKIIIEIERTGDLYLNNPFFKKRMERYQLASLNIEEVNK